MALSTCSLRWARLTNPGPFFYPESLEDHISLVSWEADRRATFNVGKCHSMNVTRHLTYKYINLNYSL